MHVLIAPDKFRGTASAPEVAATIAAVAQECGWTSTAVPLSDGGEGLLAVFGGANRRSWVAGPLGQPVSARWMMRGSLAVIEAAEACGLLLAGGALGNDPVSAGSGGVGQLLAEAIDEGAAEIVVGLGGSACTDGGKGALTALGAWDGWPGLAGRTVTVCYDVETPFVDAARVFGPQKGATPDQVRLLEQRLADLRGELASRFGVDPQALPGSGAAGGLGGGLAAVGARLTPGFERVAELVGLDDHLAHADLVITGEGRLDASSLAGKVVGGVVRRADALGVPAVAVVGILEAGLDVRFPVYSLSERCGPEAAMQQTLVSLQTVAAEVLAECQPTA